MNPYLLINLSQKYWYAAPNNYNSTKLLMGKLPHKLRIICALEAVKMALPIWEKYTSKSELLLTKEQKESPKKIIETVEKWLIGKATINEIKKYSSGARKSAHVVFLAYCQNPVGIEGEDAAAVAAANAAVAVADATLAWARLHLPTIANPTIANVIHHAAYAVSTAMRAILPVYTMLSVNNDIRPASFSKVYSKWWRRCCSLMQKEYDHFCKQIMEDI